MPSNQESSVRLAAARVVAIVAAVFCATLLALMVSTFIHGRLSRPLDMPGLQTLKELAKQQPRNTDLQQQVRSLDLLVRKAHFSTLAALRMGALLLLPGLAALLAAAHYVRCLRSTLPRPDDRSGEPAGSAGRSRRALIIAAVAILLAALLLPLLPRPALRRPGLPSTPDPVPPAAEPEVLDPARQWPSFRGVNGLGIAHHADPPVDWDGRTGRNIAWSNEIPLGGFSSPLVWGNRVFLTVADADRREVVCYDADSGALMWRHAATGIAGSPDELPEVTEDTGYAAPTPATDGRCVFAIFATGDVLALNPDGTRAWARNFGAPDNPYGHASSLLTFEDLLIVQLDDNVGGRILALRCADGGIAWRVERDVLPSWASPILAQTARGPEVVFNANPLVAAYDPRTGVERWQLECMAGEVAVSPAWVEETFFVGNEYAQLVAIRVDDDGARIVWKTDEDLPDVSSPVAASGCLFMANAVGTVTCLDAETGAVHWKHEFDDGFYSSPVVAAGRLYVLDSGGTMHVLEAASDFVELAACELGQSSTCVPAFVGDKIYIRGETHLFCIAKP